MVSFSTMLRASLISIIPETKLAQLSIINKHGISVVLLDVDSHPNSNHLHSFGPSVSDSREADLRQHIDPQIGERYSATCILHFIIEFSLAFADP